jgi:hypothetical protein
MAFISDTANNLMTFDDMPYEIKSIVLNYMNCSDIVKLWYYFPSTRNMIQSYLDKNKIDSIETYILNNLDNYVENDIKKKLLQFQHRLCYMLMLFELGYYNYAIKFCTIEDEYKFESFIKLMRFFTYIQDAFNLVMEHDKEFIDKYILLSYNTDLSHENKHKLCYQFELNHIYYYINSYQEGYTHDEIIDYLNNLHKFNKID